MLTILFNQLALPARAHGTSGPDRPFVESPLDLLHKMIKRDDEELAILIPVMFEVLHAQSR